MGTPEQPDAVARAREALAQAEAEAAGTPPAASPAPNPTQAPPEQQPTAGTVSELQSGESEQSTNDLLRQLIEQQQAQRAEIQQLREAAQAKTAVPASQVAIPTDEEKLQARMAQLAESEFYCPGCGNLSSYARQCVGPAGMQPHPAIEMVSTDELRSGDPASHTAAPAVAA